MDNNKLLVIAKQLKLIIRMSELLGDTDDVQRYKLALQNIQNQINE